MRRLALAACCLLAACGGDAPPSEAEVATVVGEALTARRDLQSRCIDRRIGLATQVDFAAPTAIRLAAPPVKDETTGRWRIRVAVSGSFAATLPPPPVRAPAGLSDGMADLPARPPATVAPPALPQRITQAYDVRFDTYIDRQDGAWRLP